MRVRGFTLIEVIIASLITSVVAAGTFMAFVAAARMTRVQNNPQNAEAADYAQQTIERFRSNIACSPPWFDASCNFIGQAKWQDDLLPGNAGTDSIVNTPTPGRRYCVKPAPLVDCAAGDCYSIQVKVCWNGTACPAADSAC